MYCCKITLNSEDKLQDVFLLDKVYNIVGYITGTLNKSNSSIFYREATFSQKEILFPELLKDYGQFSVLHTSLVTDLKFNPELGSFIFHCEAILSTLAIFEPQKLNETNAEGLMNTTIPTL